MKLAAVGSNCVDFYNNIENGKAYPGGSPVNVAVYTVRLGGEASYTGPVGDDVYGKIMQETIAAKGVDTSHLYVKPGKTAVSQVKLLEGERVFGDYEEGVLEDYTLSEEDMDFIATVYQYAFVGLMLDWIKNDMKGEPEVIVDRLAQVMHGNVTAALERLRIDKAPSNSPE